MSRKKPNKLIGLTTEQQAAVNFDTGYVVVYAGPGAGKSAVLVERYKRLVASGVDPEDMLALTFTSQAARNMSTRAGVPKTTGSRPSGFRTFHSLALAFAQLERENFPFTPADFPLATESAGTAIQVCRKYSLDYKMFTQWMSDQKRRRVRADGSGDKLALAYFEYEQLCRSEGVLDFDSLMLEMVDLLEKRPDIRDRYSFRFCQIDEGQDTDEVQFQAAKLLTEKHGNLFVVGDGNQNIFSWRGSSSTIFLNFDQYFPGAKHLFLGQNFRSSPQIVGFVKEIAPIKNELIERFRTTNPPGPEVEITGYGARWDESTGVMDKIAEINQRFGDPVPLEDIAIISRTNRALGAYQSLCYAKGFKYHLLSKKGFWEQNEVKKVLNELQIKHKFNQEAGPAVRQVIQLLDMERRYSHLTELDNNPVENLRELSIIASRFKTVYEFLDHARRAAAAAKGRKGLTLATAHRTKGLEFNVVFVVEATEGMMPHKNGDPAEEERIFYVACSRAARELYVTYSGTPSRFITPFLKKPSALLGETV